MSLKNQIDINKLPQHIAVIMDGNGRWAQQRNEQRIFGHWNGVTAVRETVTAAVEMGIRYLTLYTFSTENWKRPKEEVDALMELLIQTIREETESYNNNNIRLNSIGDIDNLSPKASQELKSAIKTTENNTGLTLTLALNYSSRTEIIRAVKNIASQVKANQLQPEQIDEKTFSSFLDTHDMPDPELLIRTSGEYRISNYLLWQIAYTELYFTSKLWPDFGKEDLYEAILDYQGRERRFGMTGEQIKKS